MWPFFNFFSWLLHFFASSQCTQSTKDVLERMVHSYDFHGLCPPGTPKTTPLGLEVPGTAAPSTEPSPSAGCSQQHACQPMAAPFPPFSRSSKRDSLHSINPAFRLASPSPSLSRTTLILGDAPDIGFIPLSWAHSAPFLPHSTLLRITRNVFGYKETFKVVVMLCVAIWYLKMSFWWVDSALPGGFLCSVSFINNVLLYYMCPSGWR